jgi:hypothetical protein
MQAYLYSILSYLNRHIPIACQPLDIMKNNLHNYSLEEDTIQCHCRLYLHLV